jgi:hypothetical protein
VTRKVGIASGVDATGSWDVDMDTSNDEPHVAPLKDALVGDGDSHLHTHDAEEVEWGAPYVMPPAVRRTNTVVASVGQSVGSSS